MIGPQVPLLYCFVVLDLAVKVRVCLECSWILQDKVIESLLRKINCLQVKYAHICNTSSQLQHSSYKILFKTVCVFLSAFQYNHLFIYQGNMWRCQLIKGETGPTQIYMFKIYIDFEFFAILIYIVRTNVYVFIQIFVVLCMNGKLIILLWC